MAISNTPSPEQIHRELEAQDKIYKQELKNNAVFSVRKAIRERVRELKKFLEQMMNRS